MSDWSHGYDVSMGYTYGFYRETAPDWLDLCAALAGRASPRKGGSAPFRYLDLGAGQGMGLALLAAANPQGDFLGVDFHPEHVAHATHVAEAAELTNIRFSGADFIALAADWPADFGTFDYVVLHGIYSWVSPEVRAALVECLRHATRPGSLVYLSYNAQPGWLGTMPFQHISRLVQETSSKPGGEAMAESIDLFERLLAGDALAFHALPRLKSRLDQVKTRSANYLTQEYLNENWQPLWHSQVAGEMAGAGLSYAGTANAAETLLPQRLPPPLRELVASQTDERLRQDLQDVALNQSFRCDIYVCGPPGAGPDLTAAAEKRVCLVSSPSGDGRPIGLTTTFGEITLQQRDFVEIVQALAGGPMSIAELAALPGMRKQGLANTMETVLLLLHAGLLGVAAAEPGDAATAQRLNRLIAREAAAGAPYEYLAAPLLGSAIQASDLTLMLLDTFLDAGGQADAAALAEGASERFAKLGRKLRYAGRELEGPEEQRLLAQASKAFVEDILPRWRRLGVLP